MFAKTPQRSKARGMTRLLLLSALWLSGCGIKGDLATPPRVFGDKSAKDVVDADPLTPELEEDGEEDPLPEPFYGPEFEDPITGERPDRG